MVHFDSSVGTPCEANESKHVKQHEGCFLYGTLVYSQILSFVFLERWGVERSQTRTGLARKKDLGILSCWPGSIVHSLEKERKRLVLDHHVDLSTSGDDSCLVGR